MHRMIAAAGRNSKSLFMRASFVAARPPFRSRQSREVITKHSAAPPKGQRGGNSGCGTIIDKYAPAGHNLGPEAKILDVAVSIVLPVYNALRASPRYLPEAIESVLGQSMRDFELVVVDDGSDEDYGPVRARYTDNRIVWLRLEKNGGQAAARNVGVDRARGKVVAFIDQDDRFYPERLERGVEAYKDCIMTYSDIDEIDADGSIMTPRALAAHQPGRHPIKSLPDLLAWDSLVLPGTCLLARETFLATGGFDPQGSRVTRTMIFLSASSGWGLFASSKRRCYSTAYTRRATGRAAGLTRAGATTSASS